MANALSGTAGSVAYITGGTTAVGAINEWSLSLTHNPVETSAFGDAWQTYIASLRGATGSFSGNGDNSDSAQTSLRNAMIGGSAVALRFYNGPDYYWEAGTAYLTGNERSISNEGKLELSYDFQVSGPISYGGVWQQNGTWSIGISRLVNTPNLSAELLSNTEFTSGTTGWVSINSATITQRNFSVSPNIAPTGGSDNSGLEVASSGNSQSAARQQPAVSVGAWLQFFSRAYSPSANTGTTIATITNSRSTVAEDTWEDVYNTFRNTANPPSLTLRAASTTVGDVAYFDAPSAKTLTLSELIIVRPGSGDQAVVHAELTTLVRGTVAGIVMNVDSISNPQNFVIAYWDGITIKLEKCVSGTYTQLISTTVTTGTVMEIRKTANTTYQLWFNGSQRGADQTVSDVGVKDNTLHGVFSANSGNVIQNFYMA